MTGDLMRLLLGGAALQLRGWTAGLCLALITGLCMAVALAFGTFAAFVALEPDLGQAWTAVLIGGVYLVFGLSVLAWNAISRRRRVARQLALAQTAALVAPALRPELLLLAAAAGALFVFSKR